MSGAARRGPTFDIPTVDVGDPGASVATLVAMMAPSAQRLRSSVIVVVPMLAVLAIWETFRIPQPAVAIFLVLVIARNDAVSTVGSAVSVAVAVTLAALIAIVVLAGSLCEPALRLPLMALMTFTTMMLVRGTRLGPIAFMTGFYATYATTEADNLAGLAASPGDVSNVEGFGRPMSAFFPAEEAMLHALLWLAVAAAVPALLLAVAERVAGTDPRRLLLGRFRDRLEAARAFCSGEAGAGQRLRALGREGTAPLLDLMTVAERSGGTTALHDAHERLNRACNRLVLLLAAWDMGRADADVSRTSETRTGEAAFLAPVAAFAQGLGGRLDTVRGAASPLPPDPPAGAEDGLRGALPSLAAEIRVTLDQMRDAEDARVRAGRPGGARPRPRPFLTPGAFGAANVQFALKVTLTVMLSYLLEGGLAWPALSSAVVTCFFVAVGTFGETVHKMALRITGCLIGATFGIGAILLLMPLMTGLTQLMLVFAPVAFFSAWVSFGSPRIASAGWQVLLAFSLTLLQGYGPTLDMQTARDRVIGILLGNVVTAVVFLFVWPARVDDAVRRDMAGALDTLGRMMAVAAEVREPGARRAQERSLRDGFTAAVNHAGGLFPDDRFEPSPPAGGETGHLDRNTLAQLSQMVVPVSVIATDGLDLRESEAIPPGLRDEMHRHHLRLQDWFGRAAAWVRSGERQDELGAALPQPPDIGALPPGVPDVVTRRLHGRASLYALVARQAAGFLDSALPERSRPARFNAPGEAQALAAG